MLKICMELGKTTQSIMLHCIDCNIPRPKFTKETFDRLSKLTQLNLLDLSYFEIESIDLNMIEQFTKLSQFILSNNRIAQIQNSSNQNPKIEHNSSLQSLK